MPRKNNGANGHAEWPAGEAISSEPAEGPESPGRAPTYDDPRQAVVDFIRNRLEARLQPVDANDLWKGVYVLTRRDLEEVLQDRLPIASIQAAAVRTPATITVDAVCPDCGIAARIIANVDRQLVTDGNGSSEIKLKVRAKALAHQHGQTTVDGAEAAGQEELPLDEHDADDEDEDEQAATAAEDAELPAPEASTPADPAVDLGACPFAECNLAAEHPGFHNVSVPSRDDPDGDLLPR